MTKQRLSMTLFALVLTTGTQLAIADDASLEEITVTAQKREQTLEKVPISVSVVSGDLLTRQEIKGIGGLQDVVPNLHVAQTPFNPIVLIRGVGSGGGDRTFEQSVSTYVDGVYAGRANQFLNPFFDVQRLEVVRGPQGVLFGVNAVAGGINITNKDPGDKFEGFVSTGYEFYDRSYHYDGAITLPVNDMLSFRIAATKGNDGPFLKNVAPGGVKLETDYDLVRLMAKWTPRDDLTVKMSAESSKRNTEGSPFQIYSLGINTLPIYGYSIDTTIENGRLDFDRSSVSNEYTRLHSDNFNVTVAWDIGGQTLTSITGYSKYNFNQSTASAAIPENEGTANALENFNQTYEELRLTSPGGKVIDYVAGLVFYRQHDSLDQGIDLGVPAGLVGFRNGLREATRSYAAFGQVTWNIADNFRALVGARYSDVKKDATYELGASNFGAPLSGYAFSPAAAAGIAAFAPLGWLQFIDPAAPIPGVSQHALTLRKVDPSASLQWDATDHVHPYFSFSTATKAGGFDDQEKSGIAPFTYQPEIATGYELGSKFNYQRLQVNVDVFQTKFKNLQVTIPEGNNVVTQNAASITTRGLEADALFSLTEHLRWSGNVTYLHAKYDDFPGSGCIVPDDAILAVTQPCAIEGVASPADTNARGKTIEFAPKFTGSFNLDGNHPLPGNLSVGYGGRAYYSSRYSFNSNQDPIDVQGGYTTYDAYLSLGDFGGRWSVKVFGKNLGNKAVLLFGGYAGLGAGHQGVVEPGRQVFLTTTWNF